ncbi:hypothetical protein MJO28_009234 [Puccinia striiformis f. sp. tritici]|uniref:Uncharacterized protein n=1 Tax=Puccinia striiformis f. sp. tritici TaxID=168172 RepID=A0ACC0E6I8_9BASI|nr:hypothetical protein MJO28_009234 [Puccinia striiformis f. sp. tritici]
MFIGLVSNAKPSLFEASRHEQSLSKLYVLLRSRSGMIAIAMPDYNRPAGSVWPSATSIVMLTGVIWLRNGRRLVRAYGWGGDHSPTSFRLCGMWGACRPTARPSEDLRPREGAKRRESHGQVRAVGELPEGRMTTSPAVPRLAFYSSGGMQ